MRIKDTMELKKFIKIEGGRYNLEGLGDGIDIRPFEIGKFPVTNSWFAEFIQNGGYENKEYWTEEGINWLKEIKAKQSRYWNDKDWNQLDYPVVGVSWYEADAFTKWLTLELNDGYTYRLLTEQEWQAAAGFDKREYPWGPEWDKYKCNNGELKLNKTSTVGEFKEGDTNKKVSDMAGNVWEWTNSFYDGDKNNYVLRGGSWFNGAGVCRCAYRGGNYPIFRSDDVGFRCARAVTL